MCVWNFAIKNYVNVLIFVLVIAEERSAQGRENKKVKDANVQQNKIIRPSAKSHSTIYGNDVIKMSIILFEAPTFSNVSTKFEPDISNTDRVS